MGRSSTFRFSFNSVNLQFQRNSKSIAQKVGNIINSGIYLEGRQNRQLEDRLVKFLGKGYVVTCASGHDALSLALTSLGISGDDEVIFPVNVYPTAFSVCLSRGKPVPADCDKNGQLDPQELKKKLTRKTKAIVLVHLYGLMGEIRKIKDLIKGTKIILIEDCAQAFGSCYLGRPAGTLGDIGCFSFYPTKNLATLGDGGALWTKDKKRYEFFLKAKSYGEKEKYWSHFLSGHSRLPEIQAGILNSTFKTIRKNFEKRKKLARYYQDKLKEKEITRFLRVLATDPQSDSVPHLFTIEAKNRDGLKTYLQNKGIPTLIHYPYPVHLQPAFSFLKFKKGHFPKAEGLAKSILSLPFHPFLSKSDINYIVRVIENFYRR